MHTSSSIARKSASGWDDLVNLHFFPGTASVLCSIFGYCGGYNALWCAALAATGVIASCAVFWLEPLLILKPVGGRFHVSTHEILGNKEQGLPPITVFHPTLVPPPQTSSEWLPFGDRNYLKGLASYVHLPSFLIEDMHFTRISASVDAPSIPLCPYSEGKQSSASTNSCGSDGGGTEGETRPVFLFSHGLSGFPRLYSTLFMDMAARGATIFAMSHMDASAAYCRDASHKWNVKLENDLPWEAEVREPQLAQRVRETRETLKRIVSGDLLELAGYTAEDVTRFIHSGAKVTLAGHSFGGATALAAAFEECNGEVQGTSKTNIASVVVFDPWHVPLQREMLYKPIAEARRAYTVPTLQFHSQAWYIWPESFEFFTKLEEAIKLQPVVKEQENYLNEASAKCQREGANWYIMKKSPSTGHLSFTDMSLLSPVVFRKSYVKSSPRVELVQWANDTVLFAKQQSAPLPKHSPILDTWK